MTRKELDRLWRRLPFWKRLLVEWVLSIVIMLLIELAFSGRSGNFAKASLEGLVLGFLYAVLDHAFFAENRKHHAGTDSR